MMGNVAHQQFFVLATQNSQRNMIFGKAAKQHDMVSKLQNFLTK